MLGCEHAAHAVDESTRALYKAALQGALHIPSSIYQAWIVLLLGIVTLTIQNAKNRVLLLYNDQWVACVDVTNYELKSGHSIA